MKRVCLFFLPALLFISLSSFTNKGWQSAAADPMRLHRTMKAITDVMVHDIYSPPVASRTYAYVSVAGYETAIKGNNKYISLAGQLHGLASIPEPDSKKEYCFELASVQAILTVAKALTISEQTLNDFDASILKEFKATGMPQEIFDSSVAYGNKVGAFILMWAAKDKYKETRSLPKYAVSEDSAKWRPTPPAYIAAIEPHWTLMRTFIIDSSTEFKPEVVTTFSTDTTSKFYKEAYKVYTAGLQLTDEQKAIANFWDCNPFKMNVDGHVMYATKKISPGGHWINITKLTCIKSHADFTQSAEAYVCVAVAIADAFISCWDEKYRSNLIRPETYINQYIDQNWMPQLQTPPFPEYTSGHSVISVASAVVLTKMFGDNFSYTDSTEKEFGLPPRQFNSFAQASREAAISRFYGGIHYMPSINNGVEEGDKIGNFVITKLKTRR